MSRWGAKPGRRCDRRSNIQRCCRRRFPPDGRLVVRGDALVHPGDSSRLRRPVLRKRSRPGRLRFVSPRHAAGTRSSIALRFRLLTSIRRASNRRKPEPPQLRRTFARDLLVTHDRSSFQDTLRKIAETLKSRRPGEADDAAAPGRTKLRKTAVRRRRRSRRLEWTRR